MTGVIPMENGTVLTAASADARGHRGLAAWLRDAEGKWNEHSNKGADGAPRVTLAASVNHLQKLTAQAARSPVRVLYTKAGTRLSACWIEDDDVIVDTSAYWSVANSLQEAAYVVAILNAAIVLQRVKDLQPVGQRDPRHFDNLVWTLPIPEFDAAEALHTDLAAAALRGRSRRARPTSRHAFHHQAAVDPGGAGCRRRGGNDRASRRARCCLFDAYACECPLWTLSSQSDVADLRLKIKPPHSGGFC